MGCVIKSVAHPPASTNKSSKRQQGSPLRSEIMQMEIPDTSHMFSSHAAREFGAFPHHSWSFPESEWPDGVHSMKMDDNGDGAKFNSSAFPWASINEVQRIRGGSCVFPASPQMNGLGMKEYFGNGDNLGSLPNMFHQRLKLSEPVAPAHGEAEGDEFFGSMEELESHAIGKLLPDDEEDLLADVGYSYERVFQASSAEEEFDLFDSGGGMELEGELQNAIINGYQIGGGNAGVLAGEHPYGEHPSRTLFVRNINSNVEDAELRALFEQYGAIRTLYTACKHRGFVMISYYDIRAARTAMRALQNKPLRRRKLDIHFSIPKDNPSDKDVNQGTLVVFNLDASVSNDDLRQIFGVYGEIKEIRETPHKKHHKFIEFYDVRAAEAALRALNRSDIAGKRIKLEPSRPGGARRSLMQQLTHELEQEEFRCQQQLHASLGTSPPGHSSQWGSTVSKLSENGRAAHPISHGTFSSFGGKPLNGVVGSLPARVSSPLRNGITSNQGGHSPLIQADRCVGHLSLRVRPQLSSLPPSDHDSPTRLAPSFAPQEGLDGARLQRSVTSIRDYSGLELSPRVLGLSPGSKSGQQLLWSSPSPYYHQMQNSPPIMYSGDHGQGHFASARANLDFSSNIHVGSGPFAEGVIDGQNGYFPELSDRASLPWSGSLDGFRLTGSNGSHVLGSSHGAINLAAIATTKGVIDSPRLGVMSPLHRARSFSNPGSLDGFSDRGKSRRVDSNAAQAENKKYQLDLDRILRGEDSRTTLMIKNIPNKYTSKMLLSTIDEHHRGTYDFIYLPIDFKNKCNVGYAFINMIAPAHIVPFFQTFNGKKWEKFNSEKVASLAYARIQGKVALIAHFQNSSLMNEDKRCRPILFHSEGPNLGDPEPFPVGSNVRTRPGRERNGICHLETSSSSSSSCSSKDDENGEHDLGQSSSDVEKD